MIELEVVSGVAREDSIRTNVPYVTIGRAQGESIVISDPYVSWHHGKISRHEGVYQYRDLSSTHGTVLRRGELERPVEQVALREGDELLIAGPENVIRVGCLTSGEAVSDDFAFTLHHELADVLGEAEEVFADDSQALRAIVRLDRAILSSEPSHANALLGILMDHIASLYPELDYVAVVQREGQGEEQRAFLELQGPCREDVEPRTSSKILAKAEGKRGGILFEIEGKHVRLPETDSVDLSTKSQSVAYGTSGICVPLGLRWDKEVYLQLERATAYAKFDQRDVNLVSALAPRVVDRINQDTLAKRYDTVSENAAIGVFSKMIAHDMKNYLRFADTLDEKLRDSQEGHLAIAKGVQRASMLALSLENLAASGGKVLSRVEVGKLIEEVAHEFNAYFRDRCTFTAVAAPGLDCPETSEELLQRVLWNLVMNAYHAADQKALTSARDMYVRIRAENAGPNVRIQVEDNAGGMSNKILKYVERSLELIASVYRRRSDLVDVVQEMERMDDFTNRVGLFFTAAAVNDMRGRMAVKTTRGQGTVFTITLPKRIENLSDLLRF